MEVPPENDCEISFKWDEYRLLIKDKIKELAVSRCRKMLRKRARSLGDARDPDYQP
jgi:hypothetical protein